MQQTLCVYHSNCSDGLGAAAAVFHKFAAYADYLPAHYDEPFDSELFRGRDVIIVDFSYPPDQMQVIQDVAKSVVWIDHHASAAKWVSTYQSRANTVVVFDQNHSGAHLAWMFFAGYVPKAISLIEDRDLWRWQLPGSREFSFGIRTYDQTPQAYHHVAIEYLVTEHIITYGKTLMDYYDGLLEGAKKGAYRVEMLGRVGMACNAAPVFASDLGGWLAEQEGSSFGLTYYDMADGRMGCSLRGRGQEVRSMAEQLGGGGHDKAAGFTVPEGQARPWQRIIAASVPDSGRDAGNAEPGTA